MQWLDDNNFTGRCVLRVDRFICLRCLDVESCSLVCWTSLKEETWVVAWKVLTGIGQLLWHACMLFGSWTVLGNWGYNCMDFVLCIKL
ncbi:unnamed protein product [Lathyrus oleraceus]